MKHSILFYIFLLCSLTAAGQTVVKKCKTCKKPLKECPYKGEHPAPAPTPVEKKCSDCGKPVSKCPYKGKHPAPEAAGYDVSFSCNVSSATLYIDGMVNGTASGSRFLKTGSHSIKLTAQGYEDYSTSITVNSGHRSFSFTMKKTVVLTGMENGHAWIDLGLSVKWATMNVGAGSPEDYGSYFAWGETSTKSDYNWETYKWCYGSDDSLTKYCTNSSKGTVDNKTTLDLLDDAARQNWFGSWRMPTYKEFKELLTECTWEWTTQNGMNGYKVSSKTNDNFIFLPAAGYRDESSLMSMDRYGHYWSSLLSPDNPLSAWSLRIWHGLPSIDYSRENRYYGLSVRAVCP